MISAIEHINQPKFILLRAIVKYYQIRRKYAVNHQGRIYTDRIVITRSQYYYYHQQK